MQNSTHRPDLTLAHRISSSPCALCRYAFVLYLTKEGTAEVLTKLNQAELTDFPGRKVTIVKSDVKNKLFIGNLPKTLSRDQIFEAIKAEVVGEWEPAGLVDSCPRRCPGTKSLKRSRLRLWVSGSLWEGCAGCCPSVRSSLRSRQRSWVSGSLRGLSTHLYNAV